MEQVPALARRIRSLKQVAASMHEGAIHTEMIPEIDKILALPDRLDGRAVGDLEAISRQLREYEQVFDRLGYSMLEQLMPTTGVSPVFQVVSAKDRFRRALRSLIGQQLTLPGSGEVITVERELVDILCRYSLSIGTPPVTAGMRDLVSRTLFGRNVDQLADYIEVLACDRIDLEELLGLLRELVDSSMHYCTASEEASFLAEAAEYVNFEGGRLFNRVVVTESPRRVIELIQRYVFDKAGPQNATPVQLVEGVDALDTKLIARMKAEPNKVFVARITRIPHRLFQAPGANGDPSVSSWLSVVGRLVLIDCSARARRSNTTIVYTLFPHVARTLLNIQTSFAGRPANTQLQLRRALERFSPETLAAVARAIDERLASLAEVNTLGATVDEIRAQEWTRDNLFSYLTLAKLKRCISFLHALAAGSDAARRARAHQLPDDPGAEAPVAASAACALAELKQRVASKWMRYFYSGLPTETYRATVVPGGGRGALTLVGEYHRQRTRELVEQFREKSLARCRERLEELKSGLEIPVSSTDEIEAAIRQSQLQALSPSQWKVKDEAASLTEHLARTMVYRAAEVAGKLADRTREGVDRAAFGNVTGGAAALLKRTMSDSGFGALHGRLEQVLGKRFGEVDRKLRDVLAPVQEVVRSAQRSLADIKGDLDPVAVAEVEAVLNVIEQGHFYPTLLLPQMSWTYHDVFPEKDFPAYCTISLPLSGQHELDPLGLLQRLEELRYLFRRFPEIFSLFCQSMLLVLNTPHNPTGVVYRRETVLKLLQIAAEYEITVLDDNAYHKLLTKEQKDREGDRCIAQIYEAHRSHFSDPVRLLTAGATTKGLQGAGDRTGMLHANVPEAIAFVEARASEPHYLSLYMTELKLESGLAAKRYTAEVEQLAAQMLDPTESPAPWERIKQLLAEELRRVADDSFPVAVFETLLCGYERLLRLKQRGANVRHLSVAASDLMTDLKKLRLERRLRTDVQKRIEQARMALLRAGSTTTGDDAEQATSLAALARTVRAASPLTYIDPRGAFYCCIKLCEDGDERGIQEFLCAIAAARGVDFTDAGNGYVRMSLGGKIAGDQLSYDQLGLAIELYTRMLRHYWQRFDAADRKSAALRRLFDDPMSTDAARLDDHGDLERQRIAAAVEDLLPIAAAHREGAKAGRARGLAVEPSERGIIYCIEEGRSVSDKVFVEIDLVCDTVEQMLVSRTFRVIYRRLLRRVFRQVMPQSTLTFDQLENQYGPLACLTAYGDRQLIDAQFRGLLAAMYREWHGPNVAKVLVARPEAGSHEEKTSALQGINRQVNELINELMFAFAVPKANIDATSAFEIGFEALHGIEPHPNLPDYLQRVVAEGSFAGATTALNPAPAFTTGAAKRVGDYRYGFIRRDDHVASAGIEDAPSNPLKEAPSLSYFQQRIAQFAGLGTTWDYVCKAVQVGPFKMLLVSHKSMFHQINDELRLFPQIEAVQLRDNLQRLDWDGVLLFGVPVKLMGETYKTGYVIDRLPEGGILPTAWVAREDATDYVGFLKKSLLTLHNERVKAMGGMPVHGAMITITFKNGLRKTLVFSADSGTGKSETITAMMEQMVSGGKMAAVLDRIDILAGDMLSLWKGEDGQIYAFGTETGDFMRLTDITETWQQQFGDLLKRGSFSNLDHPKNPRVTIPGICDRRKVLTPTRVNGFFYINNYEATNASAVEIIEDPHQVLKQVLVRGLRKNKGTSGDQPSLRAGLEFAGNSALVVRYRYALDQLLTWQSVTVDGRARTCLVYRDGTEDIYTAREVVSLALRDRQFTLGDEQLTITGVDYDVMLNLFWLTTGQRRRVPLDREIYDQIYEPLVSTFCGNPFVDPESMDRTLGCFAETMRQAKVHTGLIKTQLARSGYEYAGPAKAAEDIVEFLLEDEEVNARFQRNKEKVSLGMQTYGEVIQSGANLPMELEGYNLLLLEEHESRSVLFVDLDDQRFSVPTPYYRYRPSDTPDGTPFQPAIALPEHVETIRDICSNPDLQIPLGLLEVDLTDYERIHTWNNIEELTYQVLLLNGVINPGSSETELARFPFEVRKARHIAEHVARRR